MKKVEKKLNISKNIELLVVVLYLLLLLEGQTFFIFLSAVAQHAPEVKQLMKTKTLIGGQLAYYYNSIFGPLGASLGYSNISKTPYFYINLGYEF